ncbi:mitochondrial carrier protein [Nitzschia inconspicua]|uniref:Mitochondrial carrier protein n=1 Tax=Nitzschia inconspicua TaxID=303405 RepID=A0A9K3P8Z3_9STRA|nr:mitochondrial carrier protein [Nitzschia inconspicua]KAG7369336.1 mitochondrial carrier protein [Nitzschia inconspicua]
MGAPSAKEYPTQYLLASALAATGCYPLWRSAAIGQSGFRVSAMNVGGVTIPKSLAPYVYGFLPPYKGMGMTVFGMTYARAAIFYFSDRGHDTMLQQGYSEATATVAPPLLISTIVQVINQPIVRATVTLQDPHYNYSNVFQSIRHIYNGHGIAGLWHGTTAGVLKTVPKYCCAIAVKDYMEQRLPQPRPESETYETDRLMRSALKSATAGVAGAALTNPLDVIRNEQFKTHQGIRATVKSLWNELGFGFLTRGLGKNMIAVALPVGCTIFFTEALIQWSQDHHLLGPGPATYAACDMKDTTNNEKKRS